MYCINAEYLSYTVFTNTTRLRYELAIQIRHENLTSLRQRIKFNTIRNENKSYNEHKGLANTSTIVVMSGFVTSHNVIDICHFVTFLRTDFWMNKRALATPVSSGYRFKILQHYKYVILCRIICSCKLLLKILRYSCFLRLLYGE